MLHLSFVASYVHRHFLKDSHGLSWQLVSSKGILTLQPMLTIIHLLAYAIQMTCCSCGINGGLTPSCHPPAVGCKRSSHRKACWYCISMLILLAHTHVACLKFALPEVSADLELMAAVYGSAEIAGLIRKLDSSLSPLGTSLVLKWQV